MAEYRGRFGHLTVSLETRCPAGHLKRPAGSFNVRPGVSDARPGVWKLVLKCPAGCLHSKRPAGRL